MELTVSYADSSLVPVGAIKGAALDLAFGSGENDFELTVPESSKLSEGCIVGIVGSEYGGVVDEMKTATESPTVTWKGRTWHGMLASKVLCPDSGADYLTVSGDANTVLLSLMSRIGLDAAFSVPSAASGVTVSYRFERYCDAYSGICKMLESSGAKLSIAWTGRKAILSAEKAETVDIDTDRYPISIDDVRRPVNHLVCCGSGELSARAIVHLYADSAGNVSQTQSLFGIDEVADTFEDTNANAETLMTEGTKRLASYQAMSKADLSSLDEIGDKADVGDTLTAYDSRHGVTVTAKVTKKIVKIKADGALSIDYDTGTSSTASSHSESSGGGGTVYTAGDGISITGGVISAEVTQSELDSVSSTATGAATEASNASTEAADAAATAGTAVQTVSATSPVAVSRTGSAVAITHAASGVSAGSYGATANTTPAWGASINVGPQLSIDAKGHITSATGRTTTMPSSIATSSEKGLMSASDKSKLDGVASGANAYTHPAYTAHTQGLYKLANDATGHVSAAAAVAKADITALGIPAQDTTYSSATSSATGLMSAADKSKLDTVAIGANAYSLPVATASVLGGVKPDGITCSVASDGKLSVTGSTAASFLAAHPVGCYYYTSVTDDPGVTYGGTWEQMPSTGPVIWHRTA